MKHCILITTMLVTIMLGILIFPTPTFASSGPTKNLKTLLTHPASLTYNCDDANAQRDAYGAVACVVESYATPCLNVRSTTTGNVITCVKPGTILHLLCQAYSDSVNGNTKWDAIDDYGNENAFVSDYYMATIYYANNAPSPTIPACGLG